MNTPESTLFNAVPVVSELNRVAGFDPLRFLKKTANGHELDLRYKKLWFRLKYPAGRTRLTPLRITDQLACLLYTSPSPRDRQKSRMPSSA